MGKFDIIACRIHGIRTGLNLRRQNLVQSLALHTGTDNGCKILQRHLQGIVHS